MTETLKQRDYTPDAPGALSGVRVLDLSRLFAGNALTQILGDFGAEIIKIEPPAGDTLRSWRTKGVSTHWKVFGRNKKSLCLELRKERAREILLEMVPSAQIFVESFRPGRLEMMGLGPEELFRRNPSLVIVRISGWGQDGPYSQRPGFGTVIEGITGFASMNGFADREPVLPPIYLADAFAGVYGVSGAMVALREVEVNGGKGQIVDLPLLDPLFTMLGTQAAQYQLTGKVKQRTGSRSTNAAPRNAYLCKDGLYVCLSASIQQMTERLLRAIGEEALIDDPRFRDNTARVENSEQLDEIIGAFIAERTQAENVAFFEEAEITIGPIYDISQIIEDPHFIEREVLADYPDAETGTFPMHPVIPRLLGTPGAIRSPAPNIGQHNRELLGEVGVDNTAYAQLIADGVTREGELRDG